MAQPPQMQKYIAEFIGTYLLVFTVGCNVLSSPEKTASNWAATSIACVLMVSIYALGDVSGANFNPAVSFSLGLSGKMPFADVIIYAVVQIIAGILAGFSFHAVVAGHGQKPFLLGPSDGFTGYNVMIVEVLYTCMLCFVVLNVAVARKNAGNEFYGLAIGFVIIAGGYAAGWITGGAFNPAVAIGIEFSSGKFVWSFWYVLYQLMGAGLASCLFRIVRPDDHPSTVDHSVDENSHEYSLGEMLVAEFIGTFYLCLTVGLCVLGNSPATPWSAGAALTCMIYSLGNVSGAHFNPAVTLALVLRGEGVFPTVRAAPYMLVQLCGSIFAALICKTATNGGTYGFGPGPKATYAWGSIAAAEITFTFVLCFVVLCVCTNDNPLKEYYGFAIGSCVTVGGFAVGAISGGALNPAVALGATLVHMVHGAPLINGLAFVALELLGGALAAAAFKATHSLKNKAAV